MAAMATFVEKRKQARISCRSNLTIVVVGWMGWHFEF
jgi:hypothetical protein